MSFFFPREVALVIIQHKDWRQAMRNKTKEGNFINTPMRKLIKKLPGKCSIVAAFAFVLFSFFTQKNRDMYYNSYFFCLN